MLQINKVIIFAIQFGATRDKNSHFHIKGVIWCDFNIHVHVILKRLIQTHPHVYVTMWEDLRKAGFQKRSSVDAVVSGRRCVFLRESKSTSAFRK